MLIIGDAIEEMRKMEKHSIDLIFTDPPYGIEYGMKDLTKVVGREFLKRRKINKPREILTDGKAESLDLFENMLIEAKRVLKKGANICICCGGGSGSNPVFAEWSLKIAKHIGFKQAVVWHKNGIGMGIHYRSCYEFILVGQNGKPAYRWNGDRKVKNIVQYKKIIPTIKQHPTQKPVELIRRFVRLHSNRGDIVLDPFAGSGSTALAAVLEDRKFILIEKDEQWKPMIEDNLRKLQLEIVW